VSAGRPLPHESARLHVTGEARYIDDLATPAGCVHVATGNADVAHGRLKALDLSAVRAHPDVLDVVTAADVPGDLDVGAVFPGDPLLVDDTVSFVGQALFAVAATSHEAALAAAALAEVTVEPLPALVDVAAARAADSTVLPSRCWTRGDPDDALARAPHRIEGQLRIGGQEHFYLEVQAALAVPNEDGGVLVHASTQHPHEVQELVARVLAVPMHRVQVDCRRMGGGFGGKESQAAPLGCLAALFAVRLGRAVKYRLPRQVDMCQTGKRHDFVADYRLGFDDDGLLQAADIDLAARCGHSPDLSDGIVDRAMFHATNGYFTPHTRIAGHRLRTHTVSNTAFRGFGGPQGMVVIEAALDEAAFALQMDPLDLRLRNLYGPGRDRTPYGQTVVQHVLTDLMPRLAEEADYRRRRAAIRAWNREQDWLRRGLALTPVQFGISFTTTHLNQAGALVSLYTDGSIELSHAGTEMGQGLYTKVAQVVADAFGVEFDRVRNSATRTDKVPNGSPTAASSGSDMNGMAALDACNRIKAQLADFAAAELGWQAPLQFRDGQVTSGEASLRFEEFIHRAYLARTALSSTGFYRTPDIHFDKDRGDGQPFYYFAHGAAVSEVMIDLQTGEYRLLRADLLHDAGTPLNPAIDLGQIEGGFVQGLGWLTTEELVIDDTGRVRSDGPANYKIPTAHDLPEVFNVHFYEAPNPVPTIHRSKATGEPPLMLAISVWCALRDACAAAGGYRRLPDLPIPATPEQVFWAVQQACSAKDPAEAVA